MPLLYISINDDGRHWDKKIRLLGILIYHHHDFTRSDNTSNHIGFSSGQFCPGEIYDE